MSGAPTSLARDGDDVARFGVEDAGDDGDAGLDDAGFFAGDRCQRVAELLRVVEADAGDDADVRLADVGRVEPAAEADFEHGSVDIGLREVQKGHRGGDFEVRGASCATGICFAVELLDGWLNLGRERQRIRPAGRAGRRPRSALRCGRDAARCRGPCDSRRPCSIAAIIAAVEPLPLVPAMWTTLSPRCGSPSRFIKRRMRSSLKSAERYGKFDVRS